MRYLFLLLIALATFIRLFFAIDLTDESYYVAQAWAFLQDGKLLQSDLFIHGTSAVILSPLSFVYAKLFGAEGFVLFLRLSVFALMLLTTFAAYCFFKKHYRKEWALFAASFYLAFIPFSIASWSYNNVASLGVPLSLFLLFTAGRWPSIAAGIVASIVCFCYPPMAVVYLAALFIVRGQRKYFLATLCFGALFAALILGHAGEDHIRKAFIFGSAWISGDDKLKEILFAFTNGLIESGLLILIVLGAGLVIFRKNKWLARYDFIFLCTFLLWAAVRQAPGQASMNWLVYAPFVPLVFLLFRGAETSIRPAWFKPLLGLGFLSAIVFGYVSHNILLNCALGMLLPLQLLLLEAFSKLEKSGRMQTVYASVVFAVIGVFLSYSNYSYVYRDQPISNLDQQIQKGPFRFLFTTSERALRLEEFRQDIEAAAHGKHSIFASYFTPAYFFTNLKPVTGMLFILDIPYTQSAMDLTLHRTLEKNEWPDLVVTKKNANADFDYQFENFFLASGRYQLLFEKPEYRILSLK